MPETSAITSTGIKGADLGPRGGWGSRVAGVQVLSLRQEVSSVQMS